MNRIFFAIREFLSETFNLNDDKADETQIIEAIRRDVHFRGTNLWTLIFAIFIASIGLNVNSTAVIIGAMLISPLMGPIMGIGLSIGIYDFGLLKRSFKNLIVAAVISVATSTLYFAISPLHQASSELLARTNPSLWDVFIAFFGGLAGIVAGTRKEKSNVIPGVAIATALMPPLCTAGFGIATGQWSYFFGAFYLFFINCLFIMLGTFLIVKNLRFHRVSFATDELEKKVTRYILIIVIATVLPSVYLAYRIVQRSIFESNADKFVTTEFRLPKTQVITRNYVYDGDNHTIELLLVGQELPDELLDSVKARLPQYGLEHTTLVVHQGLDAKQKIDISEIKASILEQVYAAERFADTVNQKKDTIQALQRISFNELKILYPAVQEFALTKAAFTASDTARPDTISLFVGRFKPALTTKEKQKLSAWLKARLAADTLRCVYE